MRPINLIPPELRQGSRAPMRTGPIPYILVGALAAVLVGVTLLVVTGNQVSEREGEVAQLQAEDAAAQREARRLSAYTQFQTLHEQRVATITSLADSRFDWERVMRELSLVLPHDVWLTTLSASASPESEGAGGALRASIPGPALELQGCATGQDKVAGFTAILKDIDGVTRVGVESSELGDQEEGAGVAGGGGGGGEGDDSDCRTREFITKFQIMVAFDAAPVPAPAGTEAEVPAPAETAESTASETESGEAEGG